MKTPSRTKNNQDPPARAASRHRASRARRSTETSPTRTVGAAPPAAVVPAPADGPSAYLYGIAQWPLPWAASPEEVGTATGTGVGDPPRTVFAVPYQGIAALISRVHPAGIGSGQGVRGLRRDMCAHANVLNRIVALGGTVVPAAFGLVFPQGDQLTGGFLRPQYASLAAHLSRLEDAVEVTLKVTYVEAQAIRDVVSESPSIAQAMGRKAQSLDARIDLGRRVAQALRARREREAQRVLTALRPAVRQAKLNDPGADLMVLDASFLVPRKVLPRFDRTLEEVNRSAGGRMRFDCVGPLPPYSFVDLRM